MSEYNPEGLHAAAAVLEGCAAQLAAALPPTAPTPPPAADPISVAGTQVIDAHSLITRNALVTAISEALFAATRLHEAAAKFTTQEAANTVLLGGATPNTARALTDLADLVSLPLVPIPALPLIPMPPPTIDPEPVAALYATGPGPAGLHQHSTAWTKVAQTLTATSRSTAVASTQVNESWTSARGANASTRIAQLADWFTTARNHAQHLSAASANHAAHYRTAVTTHPDQPTIVNLKQRIATLTTQAATDATVIPELTAAHAEWHNLVAVANTSTGRYTAASRVDAPKSNTPPPPKVTTNRRGTGKRDRRRDSPDTVDNRPTTTSGETASIAREGTALAQKKLDELADRRLVNTALQIGTQVATQSLQAAQSMLGSATQTAARLATPPSSLITPGPLPGTPGTRITPGGGTPGTPQPDVPAGPGTPGLGTTPGGDELGTEPSALNGRVTPIMASTESPKPISGTTPTSTPSVAFTTGTAHPPPYMGNPAGMHGGANKNTHARNHALFPDEKVYVDTTPYNEEEVGLDPTVDAAPQITPLFSEDDDDDGFVT